MNTTSNTIMIQGTSSDVGKSLINTALCRILARDNKKVAPFKSWNMSLNSYVTPAGGEIGIAQVFQAQAAMTKATVDMQPILVKPKGDGLSQVIVRGKPIADLDYRTQDKDYIKKAMKVINKSLNNLQHEYDFIIMEGAGSPAEINRKNRDLANMKVARLNKTPVLMVANIDKGGVFASIVGTLDLLEPDERELIKGIIINKFRGDYNVLKPGIDLLEEYIDKPVLGVIPYLEDIQLPKEDSASLKDDLKLVKEKDLNIGIIRLPHISNFTDFRSLEYEPDVNLTYIRKPEELKDIDLVIIPGTKSTTQDLKYIKSNKIAEKIKTMAARGKYIIGICGGYQMMGKSLIDEYQTEGKIKKIEGLAVLSVETSFLPDKKTHQVKARIYDENKLFPKNEIIKGYEIHMGESKYLNTASPFFNILERSGKKVQIKDGAINDTGNCFGTYLHGLFNNDRFRRELLNKLRVNKGLKRLTNNSTSYHRKIELELDKLADTIRKNIDMKYIYSLLNI